MNVFTIKRLHIHNNTWKLFSLVVLFGLGVFFPWIIRIFTESSNNKIFIAGCNCWKIIPRPANPINETSSSCNRDTWKYGENQRVISYSLFGSSEASEYYLETLKRIIGAVREIYPGWLVRIHSNQDLHKFKTFCPILCSSPELLWCDVRDIPELGDISSSFGMTWRFIPIGDPLVEVFLSRDLDSPVLKREVECVNEWLNSSKALHTMRDHLAHTVPFLGGMWGAKTHRLGRNTAQHLQNEFIRKGKESQLKGSDQDILRNVLYTDEYFRKTLAHDSHLCNVFPLTECRPFPSLSVDTGDNLHFVGSVYPKNISKTFKQNL